MVDHIGLTAAQIEASSTDPVLLGEGLALIQEEKAMRFWTAMKYHWRAAAWSITLSMALVMDGYDGAIVNSFYALPAFLDRFGTDFNGKKNIPANWQTAISNVGLPGNLLALFIVGWAQDKFGSKRVYIAGMGLTSLVVFMFVFLQSLPMLLAANALGAFCWGLFSEFLCTMLGLTKDTLTAAYAAEICPIQLRGFAASFISMAWGMGSFLASGMGRAALEIKGDWSWRMPYCLQWVWPVPLFFIVMFAPESPYWLVRHGKVDEAKKVLTRIAAPGYYDNRSLDGYVTYIKHTDDLDRAESTGGSFLDMFRGSNRRRTEVMMGIWAMQVWSGTSMTAYATQFFKNAGMSTLGAFNLSMVVSAMNLVGCAIEWWLIAMWGRRPLILVGMGTLATCLLVIGIMGCIPKQNATLRTIGAFMAMINLLYHATVGPLTYTMASELPASRLRARSIAFGRMFYACNYAVQAQLTPRMVSFSDWNWGAKASFFFLGTNLLVTTWAYFRMPETGRFSYAELDILFSNRVPARKFTKVKIVDEAAAGSSKIDDEDEEKGTAVHVEGM